MDLYQAIQTLESIVQDPARGLPEDVFLLISRMTPLMNVDLLIHDPARGCLLTWRDDAFCGTGWHVPGGIVRFQEPMADRIRKTAQGELGADVDFEPNPIAVFESLDRGRKNRGHFISFLYRCTLLSPPAAELRYVSGVPVAGQWTWHSACPSDMIDVHRYYAAFIDGDSLPENRGRRHIATCIPSWSAGEATC